jgi:hypothetical protein
MPPTFTVLNGQRDEATHVCTWCAAHFLTHKELKAHWKKSPRCQRNKTVSNQTQSKYNTVDAVDPDEGN